MCLKWGTLLLLPTCTLAKAKDGFQILEYFMDVMMKPGFLFVQRLQLNVEFLALLVALQSTLYTIKLVGHSLA